MADTATYTVRLREKVSGPAKKAKKSIVDFTKSIRWSNRALTKHDRALGRVMDTQGRMREANGRFVGQRRSVMRSFRGMGRGLGAIGRLAAPVAAGMTLVAGAGAAMGASLMSAGLGVERSINALNRLEKHEGISGRDSFNEIANLSADLGLNVSDTVHQFEKLRKLQFGRDESKDLLKMGADMMALGNSAEDVQGILLAMGQIKSKGKLQGEEMMQLAERGVSGMLIKEEVAKLMGVDVGEVEGLQRKGAISDEVGLAAIQAAVNRKLGQSQVGESAKQFANETIAGAVGVAKAKGQLFWMTLGDQAAQGFGSTGAMERVLGGGGQQKAFMETAMKGAQALGKVIGRLVPLVMEGAMAFGGPFIDSIMSVFGGFIDAAGGSEMFMGKLRSAIIPALEIAGNVLGTVIGLLGAFATAAVAGFSLGVQATKWLGEALGELAFTAVEFVTEWYTIGSDLVVGLWEGFKEKWGWLKQNIVGAGADMISTMKGVLGIHSPSKEFAYLGEMSAEGFNKGFGGIDPEIAPFSPSSAQFAGMDDLGNATGGGGGGINVGPIEINISSDDPETAGEAVMTAFEQRLATVLSQYAGEVS